MPAEKSRLSLDKLKALLDARIATTPPTSLLAKANGCEPYRYFAPPLRVLAGTNHDAQRKALLLQHIDPQSLATPI